MAAKDKNQFGVISGTLVYAKIAQPDTKFESKDTEYSIQVVVDEDTSDAWDAQFAKQPAKKIKAVDFEKKFKIPLPEQFEGEKNVFVITLRKDCMVDGVEMYPEFKPKVLLDTTDGERIDISESRLIANGTIGKVSYRITSNKFGTFARLQNVLIDEEFFKEYESSGGKAGDEFGGSKPIKKEPAKESATQARKPREEQPEEEAPAKPAKKPNVQPKVEPEEELEDSPF